MGFIYFPHSVTEPLSFSGYRSCFRLPPPLLGSFYGALLQPPAQETTQKKHQGARYMNLSLLRV